VDGLGAATSSIIRMGGRVSDAVMPWSEMRTKRHLLDQLFMVLDLDVSSHQLEDDQIDAIVASNASFRAMTQNELSITEAAWIERYIACGFNTHDTNEGFSRAALTQMRKAAINKVMQRRIAETCMTAEEVLARLAAIARADQGDFLEVGDDGMVTVNLGKAKSRGVLYALKQYEYNAETGMVRIKLEDRQAVLKLLAGHHNLIRRDPKIQMNFQQNINLTIPEEEKAQLAMEAAESLMRIRQKGSLRVIEGTVVEDDSDSE